MTEEYQLFSDDFEEETQKQTDLDKKKREKNNDR